MASQSTREAVPAPRATFGVVAGIVAFLINYILAFILWTGTTFPDTVSGVIREFIISEVSDPVFAGWLLFGGHAVGVDFPTIIGSTTQNAIGIVSEPTTSLLYVTVPVVLLAGGIALARAHGASTVTDGAIAGSFLTLGYFPLVAIGAFLFAAGGDGATAQPAFAPAMLLAGLVYPTVMGAVGGVIITLVD